MNFASSPKTIRAFLREMPRSIFFAIFSGGVAISRKRCSEAEISSFLKISVKLNLPKVLLSKAIGRSPCNT